jgi:hypothetical protein
MRYADRREYMRDYQKKWIARRRAEWFKDKKCVKCGSTDRLEIDHIDPKTKVSHTVWSWAKTRREAELAKCQVLCYEHHLEKTKIDMREMDVNAHLRRIDPAGRAWCYVNKHFAPIGDFTKNKRKRRGLENECRKCRKEQRERLKKERSIL